MIKRYSFSNPDQAPVLLGSLLNIQTNEHLLDPHCVVVPSMDYANWLNVELARHNTENIAANINYYQLAEFMDFWSYTDLVEKSEFTWSKQAIQLAIFQILPSFREQLPEVPGMKNLQDKIKQFRLAGLIADVYDKYHIYRPKWLLYWSAEPTRFNESQPQKWQALLWHQLCHSFPEIKHYLHRHWSHTVHPPTVNRLPSHHIYMVAIATLPRAAARLIQTISSDTDRIFHLLEWAPACSCQDEKNSLHKKWNRQRDEYFKLADKYFGEISKKELTHSVNPANNLDRLKLSIGSSGKEIPDLSKPDDSFQIHACHNPRREAEVLHEQLLDCLQQNPSLHPDDILIVTPDLESYGPILNTVFNNPGDTDFELPHHFSDPTHNPRTMLAEQLLQILETATGRFKVSEILELLSLPAIRKTLAFSESDISQIERWLIDLNVRWGYDATHRTGELGKLFPSTTYKEEQNSWLHAFDRLWMGFSTRFQGDDFPHNCLPYSHIEGGNHQRILGKLYNFIQELWQLHRFELKEQTLEKWAEKLQELTNQWLTPHENELSQIQWINEHLAGLGQWTVFYQNPVGFEIISELLESILLQTRYGITRINGFTVISSMVPMRAIPFKVVAMVGLNEGAFPGNEQDNPFDLLQYTHEPGDRSRKIEDRQLFLDYIMAAENNLIITYTGRDERSNEAVPPSSMITKLLNTLDKQNTDTEEPDWITHHPLHAFNSSGFTYLPSRQKRARLTHQPAESPSSFTALSDLNTPFEWKHAGKNKTGDLEISIDDLIRFYSHPAKYYCTHHLKIWLKEPEQADEDYEPFTLGPLAKYNLFDTEMKNMLSQPDYTPADATYKQLGELPHGIMGRQIWQKNASKLSRQHEVIMDHIEDNKIEMPQALFFQLRMDDYTLTLKGKSGYRADDRQLIVKTGGSIKAKDILKAWILHLAVHLSGHATETQLWGEDKTFKCQRIFTPFANKKAAEQHFRTIMQGYGIGQENLLALFPESSFAWAESYWSDKKSKAGDEDKALQKARSKYYDPNQYRDYLNENNDPWYWYLFRNLNPYDKPEQAQLLTKTSRQIWQTIKEAMHEK